MKVCSIIGERVLIVTEEDSHIKKNVKMSVTDELPSRAGVEMPWPVCFLCF